MAQSRTTLLLKIGATCGAWGQITAMLAALLTAGAATAQTLSVESHFGGLVHAAIVDGDQLFAAQAHTLKRFDLSGARPRATGMLALDGEPNALDVHRGVAFLALEDRLVVVDASGSLRLIGRLAVPAAIESVSAGEGALDGLLVLALGADGLAVVDVTDPARPALLGTLAMTARHAAVSSGGDRLAVVASQSGLATVDLTDPANPALLASVPGSPQRRVRLAGDQAYLFGGFQDGLQLFDLTDPAAPLLLAELKVGETIRRLDMADDRLFLADSSHLLVLDLSDPAVPTELGEMEMATPTSLQVAGDRLVVTPRGQLRLVDISDPASPIFAGQPESPSLAIDHVHEGGRLVIAAEDGLWTYDLGDPAAPEVLEHLPDLPFASRVRAAGERIVLLDDLGQLHCLETVDGATRWLGSLLLPFSPIVDVEVRGEHAYLLGLSRLLVVDLADPASPAVTAMLSLPLGGRGLELAANPAHLVLALSSFGAEALLATVDVADPAAPAIVATAAIAGRPDALAATDHTVHVLATESDTHSFHLHAFDVSAPAAPLLVASVSGTGEPRDLIGLAEGGLAAAFASGGQLEAASFKGVPPESDDMGSVRLLDDGAGAESVALPEPGSLSAESGLEEAPMVALSGFRDVYLQSVYGSGGFSILRRRPDPVLTLSAASKPRLECPPEPDEEVAVASFGVCADLTDAWFLTAISMRGSGSGDEADDVERAILRFAGGQAESAFAADNGSVAFELGQTIGAGTCLQLDLSYQLTESGRRCMQEETKTFAVEIGSADLDAEPLSFAEGEKLPLAPILTAEVELACVENETRDLGFPQVQPAVDDPRTEDGDVISVCPGVFDEFVAVQDEDELTLRSKEGPELTFLGPETEVDCQAPPDLGPFDRVVIASDGVRLEGFTIRGARHGVRVRGKGTRVLGNDIGGNAKNGVHAEARASGLLILGNRVGEPLRATGNAEPTGRRNGGDGIFLADGLGGEVGGNSLYGNCAHGVEIHGPASGGGPGPAGSTVDGNLIRGNRLDGIHVERSSGNHIGGPFAHLANIIGGNGGDGVEIFGSSSPANEIMGNRIGLDDGGAALANDGHGILVHGGAHRTKIGGEVGGDACTGPCNAIALSGGDGIRVDAPPGHPPSFAVHIEGNHIGVDEQGRPVAMAREDGSQLSGNERGVFVRRSYEARIQGNLISGNRRHGVEVLDGQHRPDAPAIDVTIEHNRIGTDAAGAAVLSDADGKPVGNGGSGVALSGELYGKIRKNVISGNNQLGLRPGGGVTVDRVEALAWGPQPLPRVEITGNFIGTDRAGEVAAGNLEAGIFIFDSLGVLVVDNLISGNSTGVRIDHPADSFRYTSHSLAENVIGLSLSKTRELPNGIGVVISGAPFRGVKVHSNTIAGNDGEGILISGILGSAPKPTETNVEVLNNYIGTNAATADLGNGRAGIRLVGAKSNSIGLLRDRDGFGNHIYFNRIGIALSAWSSDNLIAANTIDQNRLDGIRITGSSSHNTIGSLVDDLGNKIRFNGTAGSGDGISILDSGDVEVLANSIWGNGGLPIDLDDDGPTPNDEVPLQSADEDFGANARQNFPLLSATASPTGLAVSGHLITRPGDYIVQIYAARCPEGGGPGEPETFLAAFPVTVPLSRGRSFTAELRVDLANRRGLVATATGVDGTSETSPCALPTDLVFADGFETGDTSSWSATVRELESP